MNGILRAIDACRGELDRLEAEAAAELDSLRPEDACVLEGFLRGQRCSYGRAAVLVLQLRELVANALPVPALSSLESATAEVAS